MAKTSYMINKEGSENVSMAKTSYMINKEGSENVKYGQNILHD